MAKQIPDWLDIDKLNDIRERASKSKGITLDEIKARNAIIDSNPDRESFNWTPINASSAREALERLSSIIGDPKPIAALSGADFTPQEVGERLFYTGMVPEEQIDSVADDVDLLRRLASKYPKSPIAGMQPSEIPFVGSPDKFSRMTTLGNDEYTDSQIRDILEQQITKAGQNIRDEVIPRSYEFDHTVYSGEPYSLGVNNMEFVNRNLYKMERAKLANMYDDPANLLEILEMFRID